MTISADKSVPPGSASLTTSGMLPRSRLIERTSTHISAVAQTRMRSHTSEPEPRLPKNLKEVPVAVIYSQSQPMQRGNPIDILSDDETAWVARKVAQSLHRFSPEVELLPVRDDLEMVLAGLIPNKHLVFNICESLGGRAYSEGEAAHTIAASGFVHTGAKPHSLDVSLDKIKTKRLLKKHGLPTPAYQVVDRINGKNLHVQLPAIVKPSAESGSMGITQASLAYEPEALWQRIHTCLLTYQQPVLIETYIPGREINVAIWGGRKTEILPLYEIDFRWTSNPYERIVSFDSKWVADSIEYSGTPGICPAQLSAWEARSIRDVALQAYRLLDLDSYARIDMRLHDGIPYILEVNANPDLAPNAGFYQTAKAAGYSYPRMIRTIAQLALENQT